MKTTISFFTLLMLAFFCKAQTSMTFTVNTPACNNNGVITANITGLIPPLTVTWNVQGQTSIVHTNVTTLSDVLTNYSGAPVSVYATSSGLSAYGYTSNLPFNFSPNNISIVPGVCPALGTASVSGITGGSSPYSYEWINPTTLAVVSTSNPASLPNGNYHLKITDNAGCTYTYADSLQIYQNAPFTFTTSSTIANCTNGTATVNTPTGGMSPYTYNWANGSVSQTISNLMGGVYPVTVTDAQGCSKFGEAVVQQSVTINVPTTPTNATCIQSDGAAMAFGSGGLPPYTYLWNNGQTTSSISNLSTGSYQVIATDANGCIGTGYAYISATTPINVTYSTTPSSCTTPTGSATLAINGGATPYTITWNTFPIQTGLTANNLPSGNYSFIVTDNNGCVRNGTVFIDVINPIYANISFSNAQCLSATGSASINVLGGTPPFTYLWNNSATSSSINSIPLGSYSVTVTDNASCHITKYVYVGSSSPINLSVSTTDASCIYTNDGTITLNALGGTLPYTYNISGVNGSTATNLPTGNYYGSVSDANGCVANTGNFLLGYNASATNCYCTLTGTVYHDVNSNCVQDAGEYGIPNIQIHCSGFGYVYTSANGIYSFKVPTGNYTLSESIQTMYPLSACQNNSIAVNASASSGCIITHDFANTINPIHDLHTAVWNINAPVPGNLFQQKSILTNLGTVPESTYVASFKTDGQLNISNFSPAFFGATSTANYYDIYGTNFGVGQNITQFINFNVPTNIPMGTNVECKDSIAYGGLMNNWLTDYTPWNNVGLNNATVVSSYDPNFKEVSPKGEGPQGNIYDKDTLLDYAVHFQNLGTYYAQNIVVLDTLDSDLDWKTMKLVYASHKCEVTINENGVAKFEFKNIHLSPEMYNDGFSNGMFTYIIKRKPNLPIGTEIKNSASIYFDYNDPIKTNTTLNTIAKPSGIDDDFITKKSINIYPNPTNDVLNVEIKNQIIGSQISLSIIDVSGKIISSITTNVNSEKQEETLNVNQLSSGLYFVEMNTGKGKLTSKFIKN